MEFLSSRVIIRPADPHRSLAFYRDALGLAIFREFPGGTVFHLGGGGLLEVSGTGSGAPAGPDVALWLQVREIAAAVAQVRAAGAVVLSEPVLEPWGLHEAWIRDPDGVRIALVEIPAEHPMRRDTRG